MENQDYLDVNYLFQCPACRHHIRDSEIHEHIQNCEFYYQHSSHSMSYSSLRSSFDESYSAHLQSSDSEGLKSSNISFRPASQSIAICPICYEHFHNDSHIPLLLPSCGHTICKSCLTEIQEKIDQLTCPICRSKSKADLKGLPVNFALLDLAEKMISNKCSVHKLDLVAYCKDDDKVLCGACILDHRTHSCHLLSDSGLYSLAESKKQKLKQDLEFLSHARQDWKAVKSEIDNFNEQIDECLKIHSSNLKDTEKKMIKDAQEGSKMCIQELIEMGNNGTVKKISFEFEQKVTELENQFHVLTSKLENFEELSMLEKLNSRLKPQDKLGQPPSLEPVRDILLLLECKLDYLASVKKKSLGL